MSMDALNSAVNSMPGFNGSDSVSGATGDLLTKLSDILQNSSQGIKIEGSPAANQANDAGRMAQQQLGLLGTNVWTMA